MDQRLSLITLGVGDPPGPRHSTRPSAGTWMGAWRPWRPCAPGDGQTSPV
jgi:hypothetical protein